MTVDVFAYSTGIAANDPGCGNGPNKLYQSPYMKDLLPQLIWDQFIYTSHKHHQLDALQDVTYACTTLAKLVKTAISQQHQFLTLGGDHSSAIGTWSGAAAAIKSQGPLGLIWFDAHMDSHTPETSHTKNIHGMPLATLLGHGAIELATILLSEPTLNPENIALVGIRCFEEEEQHLLEKLGVRIFYMDDIKKRGMRVVMMEALKVVTKNTAAFGISIDLDGFDPQYAPAVTVPEIDGVIAQDFLHELPSMTKHEKFIGAEIVEFNPAVDINDKTEKLIVEIIKNLFF